MSRLYDDAMETDDEDLGNYIFMSSFFSGCGASLYATSSFISSQQQTYPYLTESSGLFYLVKFFFSILLMGLYGLCIISGETKL